MSYRQPYVYTLTKRIMTTIMCNHKWWSSTWWCDLISYWSEILIKKPIMCNACVQVRWLHEVFPSIVSECFYVYFKAHPLVAIGLKHYCTAPACHGFFFEPNKRSVDLKLFPLARLVYYFYLRVPDCEALNRLHSENPVPTKLEDWAN